jgi:hypothetical protein
MTTRTKLYALHVIGAVAMSGTLLAVAPPLVSTVVGFWAVYLAMLGALYLVGWLLKAGRWGTGLRVPAMLFGCVVLWLGMTALDPAAGVMALLLSVVSLWPRKLAR